MARRDKINKNATIKKASGPDGNGGLINVGGDFRELQGTMWAHDHRFFFTAENVYKGMFMMVNYYSGPDRGNEKLTDGVNLKLPSGNLLDWGNIDFDVNLASTTLPPMLTGQLFFDIFTTDGFIGDILCVNMQYAPFMEVLPRKYRFRLLNSCMSRFIKLALSWNWTAVPFQFICNDGNLVVNPIDLLELDEQGIAERYDIIVDFSRFRIGDRVYLVNLLKQTDGRKPNGSLTIREAMTGIDSDPTVGPLLEFRIVSSSQQRRRAGLRAQVHDPRQERGTGHAHPADPDRCSRCARGWSSSDAPATSPRAILRPASAHPTVPPPPRNSSPGPSGSMASTRFPSTPIASHCSTPNRARSSTGPTSTAVAAGTIRSTCISRKASP